MPESPYGNRKRKRGELTEPEYLHLQQSSLLPPFKLSSSSHESLSDQTPVTSAALPLTRENLLAQDSTMALSTLSAATKFGKVSNLMPNNAFETEQLLRFYGIVIQAATNNPHLNVLYRMAEDKLLSKRESPVKEDEVQAIRHTIQKNKLKNETTFFNWFWTTLVSGTRSVTVEGITIEKTFDADGTSGVWDTNFHTHALSNIKPVPHQYEEMLSKCEKLSIPQPDLAYGFDIESFTMEEQEAILPYADYVRVCPYLVGTFFIVECKGAWRSIELVELQASRDAAALVRANRRLNQHADVPETTEEEPYDRNCVVSLCVATNCARMSIHWVETTNSGTDLYHCHMLKEYLYSDNQHIKDLRRDINNILDWGMLQRRTRITNLINALKGKEPLPSLKEEAASEISKKRKLNKLHILQSMGESAGQAGAA